MTNRLEVGRVSKAHGLRGDLILTFTTDRTEERTAPGAVLFLADEPFTVVSGKVHGKKWLVRLKECTTKEQADSLRGRLMTADALDDVDAVFVHELIGKPVVDQDGVNRGKVVSVLANPASDLLELDGGALVPLAFFTSITDGTVNVTVPAGLFDLDGNDDQSAPNGE